MLVTQATLPPFEKYVSKIKGIWDNYWLTNQGVLHQEFMQLLKARFNWSEVTLCVNGHMALDIAIKALGLTGEVITTPFTFVSTTNALILNNLTPVFCDINPRDYTIDADLVESLITERTSAIMAVHVYGFPCEVEKLEKIARKHNLKLIFDAAHVFGVEYKNRSIADFGDISMFSFHATKIFNSIEGGALVYKDKSLVNKLDVIKNFGICDAEHVSDVGLNAKMNEFQAAMGICNLDELDDQIASRGVLAEIYRKRLSAVPGIILPEKNNNVTRENNAYFPILVKEDEFGMDRNKLFDILAEQNIGARKYFYPLTCDTAAIRDKYAAAQIPVARWVSERVLTLPIYGKLPVEVVEEICDIIERASKLYAEKC